MNVNIVDGCSNQKSGFIRILTFTDENKTSHHTVSLLALLLLPAVRLSAVSAAFIHVNSPSGRVFLSASPALLLPSVSSL